MEIKLWFCGVLLMTLTTSGSVAQQDACGVAPLNTRIVGGVDATAGAWPWQASLLRNGFHFCGGSVINKRYILTAAHCFQGSSNTNNGLVVSLGRENQQSSNPNEVSYSVSQIINHPGYNENTNDNDICLLQLSSDVEFNDFIRPVCLAASDSEFPAGTECWVTGWGTMDVDVPLSFPQTLQEVNVPIVSNSQCREAYSFLTDNMICAGLSEGGKDSCQGDSGGPLVCKNGTVWVECGVVSFGRGCALADFPGVYARVSQYQTWINQQITSDQPGFITFVSGSISVHFICITVPLLLSLLPALCSLVVLS